MKWLKQINFTNKYVVLASLFLGLTMGALVIGYSIRSYNEFREAKSAAFVDENLLTNVSDRGRIIEFVQAEPKEEEIWVELKNESEYSYELDFRANIGESVLKTDTLLISSNSSEAITLVDDFTPPKEIGVVEELVLKLELKTEDSENIIEKEILLEKILLKNQDLVNIQLNDEQIQDQIEFTRTKSPNLNLNFTIENLASEKFNDAFYEAELLNPDLKLVQPLKVDPVEIPVTGDQTISEKIKFELPPADNLSGGTKEYILRVKLVALIEERKIEVADISDKKVSINVNLDQ